MFFIGELENEVDTLREEVLRLKGMVTSLDRERDFLQQEVDQKAELLVEAEATKTRQVKIYLYYNLMRMEQGSFEKVALFFIRVMLSQSNKRVTFFISYEWTVEIRKQMWTFFEG